MSASPVATSVDYEPTGAEDFINVVRLRGRISGEPLEVQLPSGDKLVTFRLVVPRAPVTRRAADSERRLPTIDTIDCVAKTAALRRKLLATSRDPAVDVTGTLRRRFYRGPGGLGSRYEVELTSLSRCPSSV